MGLKLSKGEKFVIKGRTVTVTDMAFDRLPGVRSQLVAAAKAGSTVTYGRLKRDQQLTYAPNGMGRLLDLLSVDCFRRNEPSLACLVVNVSTGEVGIDFDGDPIASRHEVFRYWS